MSKSQPSSKLLSLGFIQKFRTGPAQTQVKKPKSPSRNTQRNMKRGSGLDGEEDSQNMLPIS